MKKKVLLFLLVSSLSMPAKYALPDGNLDAAVKLFQAQEYKKAIDHLKKATKEDPSNTEAWVIMGNCYQNLGKDTKAIKAYGKAIRLDPSHKEALLGQGISYGKSKKHAEAIAILKQLVELDPSSAAAHFYLGVSFEAIRNMSLAWEEYKILKNLDKKLADRLYHIILG